MNEVIYRRAHDNELAQIITLQSNIFHAEQGIPEDDVETFLTRSPICWCAELAGKICGTAIAWKEDNVMHWGRFVVVPEMRGQHIGAKLARYTFEDLFHEGVDEICMTARDTTVKIVCGMGGEIVGESYLFYGGNVTPVVLKKEKYSKSAAELKKGS